MGYGLRIAFSSHCYGSFDRDFFDQFALNDVWIFLVSNDFVYFLLGGIGIAKGMIFGALFIAYLTANVHW